MANSVVEICNAALSNIKQSPISALNDSNDKERQCKILYPFIRDRLLRSHTWNFAEKRRVLAASAETPPFEFDHYYILPADCIRALRLYGTECPFRVEEGTLLATDADTANLIYTARIENVARFDPVFTTTLVYMLAAELAMVLHSNNQLADRLRNQAEAELRMAKMYDGQEGTPYKRRLKRSWLDARRYRWRY
jgi:hypothetical protein